MFLKDRRKLRQSKISYSKRRPEDEIAFVTDKGIEKVLTDKLAKTEGIDVLSTIRVTDY